jgi:hypothetical protein
MSRAYSNHFHTTGVSTLTGTTTYDRTHRPSAGIAGARARVKIGVATVGTAGMTSGDELRMVRLRSSDRIWRISWSAAGTSTTYAASLGVYDAGDNGDGAVCSATSAALFDAAIALAGGAALTEAFAANSLTDEDRGKQLWELINIGTAATYTTDPMIDMDIVVLSTATGTTAIEEVLVVVEYTAGD